MLFAHLDLSDTQKEQLKALHEKSPGLMPKLTPGN